jgi:acyl-CoA reductase-like NAD-dependent aldehyde dehydrogenase
MLRVRLMIGDRDLSAADGRTFHRIDPVTGEVATEAAAAGIPDAIAAAEAAARALSEWSILAPAARRAKLEAAADVIASRAEDFGAAMMAETGATPAWCELNVRLGAALLREAAALTTHIGSMVPADMPGRLAMAVRQPAGVVLGIAHWNAPVALGVRAIATPLACGNTVVLKASELCPATHRLIGTALRDAGFPHGVVNVVTHAPEDAGKTVETLIAHPAVRRISFTGFTRVGRSVAETAARYLKPAVLELSGKAPLVVLDDADLDEAVSAAASGAFVNSGQVNTSTERVVVDSKVADAFVDKLVARARSLTVGDPNTGDVALGPLVNQEATLWVRALVDDALAKGARLLTGGEISGNVMPATVLDGVTPEMRIHSDESFGPVVIVLRASGVDEAVRLANDTEYGLAAAVFGRDLGRAMDVARRIESGVCHINAATVCDEPRMPFGGMKASGYGRFGGMAGVDAFTDVRWITVATGKQGYPF